LNTLYFGHYPLNAYIQEDMVKELLASELTKFEDHKEHLERGNQESDVEKDSDDKNSQS
jgi:hypothetical protein